MPYNKNAPKGEMEIMKKRTLRTIIIVTTAAIAISGCHKKHSETEKSMAIAVTNANGEVETVTRKIVEKVTGANGEVETVTKIEKESRVNAEGQIEEVTKVVTEEVTKEIVVVEEVTKVVAKAESTKATNKQTVASTEVPTEAPTEAVTNAATEAVTQTQTQAPTEAATQVQTQAPTQAATQVQTQAPTQAQPTMYEVWVWDDNAEWSNYRGTFHGAAKVIQRDYSTTGSTFKFNNGSEVVDVEYNETSGLTIEEARAAVLEGFNAARAEKGYPAVSLTYGNANYQGNRTGETTNLTENAQNWANFMAANNYFHHANSYTFMYDPSVLINPICDDYVNEGITKIAIQTPFITEWFCYEAGLNLAFHCPAWTYEGCESCGKELVTEVGIGVSIGNGNIYVCMQSTN